VVASTERDRLGLQRANEATAGLLWELARRARPGATSGELDDYAAETITRLGGQAVFRTQNGSPASIDTSVDDEAVQEGLVFTIEPIVVGGGEATVVDPDGWTVGTVDGAPAAQFEHTIIMTRRGAEILSSRGPGRQSA